MEHKFEVIKSVVPWGRNCDVTVIFQTPTMSEQSLGSIRKIAKEILCERTIMADAFDGSDHITRTISLEISAGKTIVIFRYSYHEEFGRGGLSPDQIEFIEKDYTQTVPQIASLLSVCEPQTHER